MSESPPPRSDAPPGPGSFLGIAIIAAVLIVDQISKVVAEQTLDVDVMIDILPILALYLTYNPGIAFSFLRGADSGWLLGGVIVVTLVVLVFWMRSREGGKLAAVGFGLIVGGAVGNIIDRIAYGHVIDFLLLHIGDRTPFIFNLADVALTLGPIVLIVAYLFMPRRSPA
ncbi:MAG: signal peptidase II [Bauldia sp.]|nr:signal peptidase II [Bauldia sp.]